MNKRTLFGATVICLGLMASATVAEAMPASSLGTVTAGTAQIEKAAVVIVRRPRVFRPRVVVRRRVIVRRPAVIVR